MENQPLSNLTNASALDWLAMLAKTELLQGVDASILQRLAAELTLVQLRAGETLIRQGDPGDCMYVVVSGRLRAVSEQADRSHQFLREIGPGESIGEIALLTGQTRTATVYGLEDTQVARLAKTSLDQLAAALPEMAEQLQNALTAHIRRRQLRTALRVTHLFNELDEALLRDLEAELTWLSLVSGEVLLHQGDAGDCMYVIVSGRLRVVLPQEDKTERRLRELGRGETLGEIALLTDQRRTATVYAIRDSEVAKLSKVSFDRLLGKHPHAMTKTFTRSITNIVLSRERGKPADVKGSLSVAIVPTHSDLPLAEFTQRLVRAFAALGSTLHLNSARVDHFLGKQGIAQDDPAAWSAIDVQLVGWLSEQESEYRYLIYEVDPTPTPWTERCLRQADHVVLVGSAASDPVSAAALNHLAAPAPGAAAPIGKQTSLVLLHRHDQRLPSNTMSWLSIQPITQHHHVRWNRAADFARVARIIAGCAVGLVLGGGGARCAAHAGVLQALEEAEIPVDIIGGTSAGALMAALYAMGTGPAQLIEHFTQFAKNSRIDFTLPVVALAAGNNQNEGFKALFGVTHLEDLWLPSFCVSTNLTRAEVVIHRTGLVWQSVRASSGVPGIYPPVVHQNDLLVDGGLLNNLPINIMRDLCSSGAVIAVDVTPPVDLAATTGYGDAISGWRAMWENLNPWANQSGAPNIMTLLYRAGEVGSIHALKTQLGAQAADLYLRPPVAEFGLFAADAIEKIAALGYHHAKASLQQWQNGKTAPITNDK